MNEDILDAELLIAKRVRHFARVKALFYDALTIFLIFPLLLLPFIGILWLIEEYMNYGCFIFYMASYITLVLQKDVLNGRSLGKRMAGLQIIEIRTHKKASRFKCVLRNILVFFFVGEIAISLFSPERKLGDWMAGTKLVVLDKVPFSEIKNEFKAYDKITLLKTFSLVFLTSLLSIYLITLVDPLETTFLTR